MSQQFCLKWNNHTSNLLTVFKSFQSSETLVDVTLSCEGQNLKAHKVVLSACSPYFQSLFTENPCKHPIVIINGMKFTDVRAILDFMYKGEVNISHDGLQAFLKAAETLKVKGLAEVCGENKVMTQEVVQTETVPPIPQRSDTPTKKRNRTRKRSLSDSNRSDDEGVARKMREQSPEVHELSGDESYTGDMKSNDGPTNSLPQVPGNAFSRSHMSELGGDAMSDDDYEVEPSKLLEQTLTTDSVPLNNQVNAMLSDSSLKLEKRLTGSSNMESSSLQGPDSPPDIKPIIQFDDSVASSGAGTSDGTMVLYNDQSLSQPGPSNFQDGTTVLHDGSQAQDDVLKMLIRSAKLLSSNKINNHSEESSVDLKCEHCSYVTNKIINFEKHLSIHIGNQTYDCSRCGEEFFSEIDLVRHLCTSTGDKMFACEFCTKEFAFQTSLRKHVRRHTGYQSHKCDHCNKKFHDKSDLGRHLRTHKGEKNFECELCDKSFFERKELLRHIQSHSGEKPFDCEECGKKFSRKNDLVRHSRLHTGERHFNCEYCGKEFYRKDKLNIHVRVHTGEKPFTCEYCGKRFTAKTDMIRHFRLHTGGKNFLCEFCGKNFNLESRFHDHVCIP